MYTLKPLMVALLFILSPSFLFPTMYENASNKKNNKWHVLKYFSKGVIKNIYDKKKKSRVIQLKGNATKSVYILMPKKKSFQRKKGEDIFQWEMNFDEDFVIMIGMHTLKGKRYLIYTSGEEDSYLQYGLGEDSTSGKWKQYSRNLQEDLEHFDRYNKIISVNSFVIKGSGRVDNIEMVKSKKSKKKVPSLVLLSTPKLIDKKTEEPIIESNKVKINNQPPVIYLEGANPMILKKGEPYIEPGATAKNRDGSTVVVTISEDIDIFKNGEYSVIYMATNRAGHSAVDRRRVRVGMVQEEKENSFVSESSDDRNSELPPEEEEEEGVDLEQRALEILDWEKQLASREQELDREKSLRENPSSNISYPSRPGL